MENYNLYHFKSITKFINMGYVLNQEIHPDRILPFWVLGIVTNGSVNLQIDNVLKKISSNEYYLLPPNTRHFGIKKGLYNVIYCHFEAISEINNQISNDKIILPVFGKVPISIDFQSIYNYFRHALISEITNTDLMKIVIESILLQLSIENSIKRLSSDRLWSIVQNVTHYLNNNYFENITHELLEKEFCYSYVHLNRIYKQYTKETIFKQLEMIRIKAAEEKILMGQQIKNITTEVGFDDYYYFLKKFKKITGLTPKEFYHKYFPK